MVALAVGSPVPADIDIALPGAHQLVVHPHIVTRIVHLPIVTIADNEGSLSTDICQIVFPDSSGKGPRLVILTIPRDAVQSHRGMADV